MKELIVSERSLKRLNEALHTEEIMDFLIDYAGWAALTFLFLGFTLMYFSYGRSEAWGCVGFLTCFVAFLAGLTKIISGDHHKNVIDLINKIVKGGDGMNFFGALIVAAGALIMLFSLNPRRSKKVFNAGYGLLFIGCAFLSLPIYQEYYGHYGQVALKLLSLDIWSIHEWGSFIYPLSFAALLFGFIFLGDKNSNRELRERYGPKGVRGVKRISVALISIGAMGIIYSSLLLLKHKGILG